MKRLKGLFGLLVLAATASTLWQVIPPIFNNYQFEDAIRQEGLMAAYSTRSEQDIHDSIFRKATDLAIPIARNQIKVQRNGSTVSISAAYKVSVHLPVYPFDMNFTPSTTSQRANY